MSKNEDVESGPPFVRLKIISIGNNATGKSCLIKRFCEERFVTKYIPTIGVDYGVKPLKINSKSIRINFWDLSGYPEFLDIRNEFYKDTQGCILVYDVTQRSSFEALQSWIDEACKYGADPLILPTILCANKTDKRKDQVVTGVEGKAFADKYRIPYFETSAQSGSNVADMFNTLFQNVLQKIQDS